MAAQDKMPASAYERLLSAAGCGVLLLDTVGAVQYVGPGTAALLQRADLPLGAPLVDLFPLHWQNTLRAALNGTRSAKFHLPISASDGPDRWLELSVTPLEEGGTTLMLREITGYLSETERLRMLQAAVEQANDAVVITDAELEPPGPRIVYANPAFCAMTGYSLEQLIDETPRLLQGYDTDRAVLDALRAALDAEQPFQGQTINYRQDGTPYTVRWSIAPVRGLQGQVTHFISVQNDVSQYLADASALARTQHERDALLRALSAALYSVDTDGILRGVRGNSALIPGLRDAISQSIQALAHLDPALTQVVSQALEGQPPAPFTLAAAEDAPPLRVHPVLITDPDSGALESLLLVAVGAGAAPEADALSPNPALLYRLLARSLDHISLLFFDRDLRFVLVEGEDLRRIGYPPEHLVGRTLEEVVPEAVVAITKPAYQAALRGQKQVFSIEDANMVYDHQVLPVRDAAGEVIGGLVVARNVTDTARMQQMLTNRVQQLETLRAVETVLADERDVDRVMATAWEAAQRITGACCGFLVMLNALDESAPVDESALPRYTVHSLYTVGGYERANVEMLIETQRSVVGRVLRTRHGELLSAPDEDPGYIPLVPGTTAIIVVPLMNQGRLTGLIQLNTRESGGFTREQYGFIVLMAARVAGAIENAHLFRELSTQLRERQALLERVEELETLKTQMIRIASHDLRAPITVMVNYLYLFKQRFHAELMVHKELYEYMQTLEGAVERMRRLTTDILSVERIDAAVHGVEMSTFNLADTVQSAYDSLLSKAVVQHQTYTLDPVLEPTFIEGDAAQVELAVANLLSNAVQYTSEGGTIRLRLWQEYEAGKVHVSVTDSGPGISPAHIERLFAPFVRLRTPALRDLEGSGLGLYLVKSIVQRHGGEVNVESELEQGSTFGFWLPIKPETKR